MAPSTAGSTYSKYASPAASPTGGGHRGVSKSFAGEPAIARMAGTLQTAIGRRGFGFLLVMALLGGFPLPAPAARPDTVELRNGTGSVGRLPRVVVDDGGSYVAAEKLTSLLKGVVEREGLARHAHRRQAQRAVRPRPAPRRRPGSDDRPRCRRAHGLRELAHPRGFSRQRPAEAGAGHCGGPRAQEADRGEAGPGQRRPRRAPPSLLSVLHPDRRRDRRHPRVLAGLGARGGARAPASPLAPRHAGRGDR